jgi:hypothetical protein
VAANACSGPKAAVITTSSDQTIKSAGLEMSFEENEWMGRIANLDESPGRTVTSFCRSTPANKFLISPKTTA